MIDDLTKRVLEIKMNRAFNEELVGDIEIFPDVNQEVIGKGDVWENVIISRALVNRKVGSDT